MRCILIPYSSYLPHDALRLFFKMLGKACKNFDSENLSIPYSWVFAMTSEKEIKVYLPRHSKINRVSNKHSYTGKVYAVLAFVLWFLGLP